ncbi:3-keto-5-aminohexanoate cleavage protein [Halodurantibacterium flavum]|uniref:3-keto-5-aminohexanoate cleavage protein n=1 Tax=Halodurantibacterium flavum TaxID=1382802 RepID=A0ABW4S1X2_9RHOB
MIVQACINGARPAGYHPALPLTTAAMVAASVAAIDTGAAELHIHARNPEGRESLAHVDEVMTAIRAACPGTLTGVSTGAWIEADETRTRAAIRNWRVLPDYASVNLSEPDAPAIIALLQQIGVGVEAGLATVADAHRLAALPERDRVLRILIEIEEQDITRADQEASGIAAVLEDAGIRRPVLLHGFDATVWHFVRQAKARRWSTRVGLEDGLHRPSGQIARDTAELVADAVAIFRGA